MDTKYAKIGDRMEKLWSAEVKVTVHEGLLFKERGSRVSISGNPVSLSSRALSLSSLPELQ